MPSAPEQEGVCRDREHPLPALGTEDDVVAVLLEELPPPARPAPRLVPARRRLRRHAGHRGTCNHRQGAEPVPRDGACGLLGGLLQVPRVLTFLAAAVLAEAPLVGGVEGGSGLVDGLVGQQHHLPARARVPIVPLSPGSLPAWDGIYHSHCQSALCRYCRDAYHIRRVYHANHARASPCPHSYNLGWRRGRGSVTG